MRDYIREQGRAAISECDLFVGLDVDKSSISVSVNNGQAVIRSLTMPYNSGNLLSFIDKHYSGERVMFAYEAGPARTAIKSRLQVARQASVSMTRLRGRAMSVW